MSGDMWTRVARLEEANRRLLKERDEYAADKDLYDIVVWGLKEAEKCLDELLEQPSNLMNPNEQSEHQLIFTASKRITDALDAAENMKLSKL